MDDRQVEHIANLARLKLAPQELHQLKADLDRILNYFQTLNELDTAQVEPMEHVIETQNVLRPDVPTPSVPRERALQNAPHSDGEHFVVPGVFERGDAGDHHPPKN